MINDIVIVQELPSPHIYHRRVFDTDGLCPTIMQISGSGQYIKILVKGGRP